jgi:hypothetical protein
MHTIRFIDEYDVASRRELCDIFHLVGIVSEVVSGSWAFNVAIWLSGGTVIGHPAPKPPPIQPLPKPPPKPPPPKPPPSPPPQGNHGAAHRIALPDCGDSGP